MEVRQTAPFRQMVEEEVGRDASPYMAGIVRLQEQNGAVFLRARQQHGLKKLKFCLVIVVMVYVLTKAF